ISVILPTYNERDNVVPLARAIAEELAGREFEVLVVDDNSPDGTCQAVNDIGDPRIRGLLRTENRGFANSIRCGLENARGDLFIIMDSDWNHQPKYLPVMIEALEFYDCVSGSRFVYGGRMNSRRRHLLSWTFNIFTRLMTSGQITDSLYGFVAIHRRVLEKVDYDAVFWGYGDYCIRLMYYLQRQGATVLQIPVVNGERQTGEGNDRFFKVFMQYFREVVALTWRARVRGNDASSK
ncbi:MAG: putative glycosyltransferase family 2, partial [Myxococcales bacterium]|nr:putative glycosyltransferase family 2 [Myxococcales bacterium]